MGGASQPFCLSTGMAQGSAVTSSNMSEESEGSSRAVTRISTPSIGSVGRPRRSQVLEYFEYNSDRNKSVCQVLISPTGSTDSDIGVCGYKVPGKFPTNLKHGIKSKHVDVYSDMLKKKLAKERKRKKKKHREKISLKHSRQLTL